MVAAVGGTFLLGGAGRVGGRSSEVELLSNGRLATVWVNQATSQDPIPGVNDRDTTAILLRLSDPDGTKQGPVIQVNTTTSGMQGDPQILALSDGRFVVAWTDGPSATGAVEARAQIFSGTGNPIGKQIQLATTTEGDQELPGLVATNGGEDFMAFWTDDRTNYEDGMIAQHFDGATGKRLGDELTTSNFGPMKAQFIQMTDGTYRWVNEYVQATRLEPNQDFPSVMDFSLGILVGSNPYGAGGLNWDATAIAGNRYVIAGQFKGFFDAAPSVGIAFNNADPQQNVVDDFGRTVRMDQAINTTPFAFAGDSDPQVHALKDGGFLVVWVQPAGTSTAPNYDIYAQQFDRDFYAVGGNVLVHSGTAGQQYAPSITDAPNGRVLISWTSDQRVDGGNPSDVYGRIFRLSTANEGKFAATAMNDKGVGTATGNTIDLLDGGDWFDGKGGNDSVLGGNGNDFLIGGTGNDSLYGGMGSNVLSGGAGNDQIEGGFEFSDWLLFQGTSRFKVDLSVSTAQDTGEGRDTILSIENVRGGDGGDRITGNAFQNRLEGGGGSDVLDGGDSNDTLLGGSGNDTLRGGNSFDTLLIDAGDDLLDGGKDPDFDFDQIEYTGSANGVVNLAAGTATFTGLGTDKLVSIEGVITGTGNDKITGNAGNNSIRSDWGKDTVDGGAGDDSIQLDFHIGATFAYADTLIYRKGGDADVVRDFNDNLDVLRLDVTGITTVAKALAKATEVFGSVVFDFGNGDTLTIDGMTKATIANDIEIL